jgi:uncharacterized membrane protein HdeD (DUF308 family)
MLRVRIRSRAGNRLLAVAGALYAIAGLALLIWFVVESWGAASIIDRGLQFILAGAVVIGLWFVYIARQNLADLSSSQPAQQRRANAEVLT